MIMRSEEADQFVVCEGHLDLFDVNQKQINKKTRCAGCNIAADRNATLKNVISLASTHNVTITIGDPICSRCKKVVLEDETEFNKYLEDEHRYDQFLTFL